MADTYAVVIGGVNIDIGGRSFGALNAADSNPGRIRTAIGGVGCNIARNMSLLGVQVVFLTVFGEDVYGTMIEAACAEQGIDIRYARKVAGGSTSMYVFLGGPDGDMALAVSDMEICEQITPEYISSRQEVLDGALLIVIDANLPEETIRYVVENSRVPVYADPVSAAKAVRLKPYLGRIHTIKPNRLEAEVLSGVRVTDEASAREAAKRLIEMGVKRVFLSMGPDGMLAAEQTGQEAPSGIAFLRQPCLPVNVRNTTGAGDAFMASLAASGMQGTDTETALRRAAAAGALTAESEETIDPALSAEAVERRMRQ